MKERREFPEEELMKTEVMGSLTKILRSKFPSKDIIVGTLVVVAALVIWFCVPTKVQHLQDCQSLANDLWSPLTATAMIPLNGRIGTYEVVTTHNTGIIDFLYPDNLGYECRLNDKQAWYILLNPNPGVSL